MSHSRSRVAVDRRSAGCLPGSAPSSRWFLTEKGGTSATAPMLWPASQQPSPAAKPAAIACKIDDGGAEFLLRLSGRQREFDRSAPRDHAHTGKSREQRAHEARALDVQAVLVKQMADHDRSAHGAMPPAQRVGTSPSGTAGSSDSGHRPHATNRLGHFRGLWKRDLPPPGILDGDSCADLDAVEPTRAPLQRAALRTRPIRLHRSGNMPAWMRSRLVASR